MSGGVSANQQMIAAEFKLRRRAYLRIAVPSLLLVVVAVGILAGELAVPRWISLALFGAGLMGYSLSARISRYACPKCDGRLTESEGWFPSRTTCQACNVDFKR
jgi:hypothetical protein